MEIFSDIFIMAIHQAVSMITDIVGTLNLSLSAQADAGSGGGGSDIFSQMFGAMFNENTWSAFQSQMDTLEKNISSAGNSPIANFSKLARNMCAIFTLIFVGSKAFGLLLGEEKWDIRPLLKPFVILLVLTSWSAFCSFVRLPGEYCASVLKQQVSSARNSAAQATNDRCAKMEELTSLLNQRIVELKKAQDNIDQVADAQATAELSESEAKEFSEKMMASFGWIEQIALSKADNVFDKIGNLLFNFGNYLILLIKAMFSGLLYMLGPISFAFSILGPWKSNWSSWVSRYISVSFYTPCLYYCQAFIYKLIEQQSKSESDSLKIIIDKCSKDMTGPWEEAYSYLAIMGTQTSIHVVLLCIGGAAVMYVPTMTNWIVETSGTGSAVTGMIGGAGAITMMGTRATSLLSSSAQSIVRGAGQNLSSPTK